MNADKREPVLAEALWDFVSFGFGAESTYERHREQRNRVRFLERIALGAPYLEVVERARRVVRVKPLVGRCSLAMDATGVWGGPCRTCCDGHSLAAGSSR